MTTRALQPLDPAPAVRRGAVTISLVAALRTGDGLRASVHAFNGHVLDTPTLTISDRQERRAVAEACAQLVGLDAATMEEALLELVPLGEVALRRRGQPTQRVPGLPRPGAAPLPATDPPVEERTDLGNARRLATLYGGTMRHVRAWGWLCWDGMRWRRDETGQAMRNAKGLIPLLYQEVHGAAERGDTALAEELAHWAKATQSRGKLEAALGLAETEPAFVARVEDFDQHPMLLNTPSGTVDLTDGSLHPHRPADLLTKITRAPYEAEAPCPLWDRFLPSIQPDPVVRAYLQRAAGYSASGDTREQTLFFLHGEGQNGKTTFLNALAHALGDYASTASTASFMMRRHGEAAANDLAALVGSRLVLATEAEEGQRLAESLIKRVTGEDALTVRFLFHEYFSYVPTWKLWLAANHKPVIRGTDHAIWRRIPLIPFSVRVDRPERQLPGALRAEAAGILAWAVEGCLAWQREGLKPPPEVAAASGAYRREMDVLGRFLEECCVLAAGAQVSKLVLFAVYKTWCDDNNEYAETSRRFGKHLEERGVHDHRATGGLRCWRGIELQIHTVR